MDESIETTISQEPQSEDKGLLYKTFSSSNDILISKTFSSSNEIINATIFEEKKYLIQTYLIVATLLATLSTGTSFFVYVFFIISILFYTAIITNSFNERGTKIKGTVVENIDSRMIELKRALSVDKSVVNYFATSVGIIFGFLVGGPMMAQASSYNCYLPSFVISAIILISSGILILLCVLSLWV